MNDEGLVGGNLSFNDFKKGFNPEVPGLENTAKSLTGQQNISNNMNSGPVNSQPQSQQQQTQGANIGEPRNQFQYYQAPPNAYNEPVLGKPTVPVHRSSDTSSPMLDAYSSVNMTTSSIPQGTIQNDLLDSKIETSLGSDELNQTSTYQEESYTGVEEREVKSSGIKRFIVPIGILAGVLVVILGTMSFLKSSKAKKEAKEAAEIAAAEEQARIEQEELEAMNTMIYTEEEKSDLRARGYTGDDIEAAEKNQTPPQSLIDKADEERRKYLEDTVRPYYQGASEEFKKAESKTWLGQEKVSTKGLTEEESEYDSYGGNFNADYEKIGIYGAQAWVKVTLNPEGTLWGFMYMRPERYIRLPKSKGNINIKYEYLLHNPTGKYIIIRLEEDVRD